MTLAYNVEGGNRHFTGHTTRALCFKDVGDDVGAAHLAFSLDAATRFHPPVSGFLDDNDEAVFAVGGKRFELAVLLRVCQRKRMRLRKLVSTDIINFIERIK